MTAPDGQPSAWTAAAAAGPAAPLPGLPPKGKTPAVPASKLTSAVSTTAGGTVTFTLSCPAAARCTGTAKLVSGRKAIGSTHYALAAHQKAKVKIKLTAAGRKLLKHHHGKLPVTLTLTPTGGRAATHHLTLKAKR